MDISNTSSLKRLVVYVPGLGGTTELWKPLIARLKQEPGYRDHEADWLPFDHNVGRASMGRLADIATNLRARIDERWDSAEARGRGYGDIVLAGQSLGGLLIRQAYLNAAGALSSTASPAPWASKVTRIVLIAAPNSGATRYKTSNRVAQAVTRPFGLHLVASDLFRGSDFITNLRINWIRYFATLLDPPSVVQFRGTLDVVVKEEDSTDVLSFPNAEPIPVADAGHDDILDMHSDDRYAKFRKGFVSSIDRKPGAPLGRERVVFVLHGIRASNVDAWLDDVEKEIKRQDPSAIVKRPEYGYLTPAAFVRRAKRTENIPWFQETYSQVLSEHRNAEFNFIGHSNGTYILGESLASVKGMKFNNVVLAGSVLPVDYDWDQRIANKQIGRIRNDRADRDWPVGLLCSGLRGLFVRDVGTGGFDGFKGHRPEEVAYFKGDHGVALRDPDNVKSIVRFALGVEFQKPVNLPGEPRLFGVASRAMPYLAFLTVAALLSAWLWPVLHGGGFPLFAVGFGLIAAVYVILDVI